MTIEIWTSDKGQEEIHHFISGERNTYLFGFNKQLLGDVCYNKVLHLVEERLSYINEGNS